MVLALKDTADFKIPTKNIVDNDSNFNYSTVDSINAYDRTYLSIVNANRSFFFPPANVLIERSTDGGSTWTTVSTSDYSNENRGKMFSDVGASGLTIGTGNAALTQQLRVTMQSPGSGWYCSLDRAYLRWSNSGHTTSVTIQASTYGAQSTYTNLVNETVISGWSGNDMYKFTRRTAWGTNNSNHLYNIRFIFKYTAINSNYPTNQANLIKINMYGADFWGTSGTPRYAGHLYNWDYLQNVTFPAKVITGTAESDALVTRKIRSAGEGTQYYHGIDLGYGGHDRVDFYEYGGVWNFWRNQSSTATTDTNNLALGITIDSVKNKSYTYTWPNKSGTIALTSDTPPLPNNIAYIGSEVAGGGTLIEGSDIDWSTVASGADGEYILTKDNGTVSWKQHSYRRGDFLAITKNTTTLTWHGTSKTRWSLGTWTQYGPMAATTNLDQLVITTPADESWDVRLHHVTGSVQTNSKYGFSGIYRQASSGNLSSPTFMTESLTANGDLYIHQESETVVTIPAGTTWYFGVYVVTSSSTDNIWYGGGDTTSTGIGFSFGNSCVLEATLIDKRKV